MWRAIEEHLASERVSRVTYGAIVGMAVIVVLEHHPSAPGAVAGTLVATGLAVALAEVYSEVVGVHARTRQLVDRAHLGRAAGDGVAVAVGVAFPAVFFVLATLGVLKLDTAFTVAKWSGLALIGFYGFSAARLSGSGWLSSMAQAATVVAIGAALIAFKALVH